MKKLKKKYIFTKEQILFICNEAVREFAQKVKKKYHLKGDVAVSAIPFFKKCEKIISKTNKNKIK